jgi:hypothetical protein
MTSPLLTIVNYFGDNSGTRSLKRGGGDTKIICKNKVYTAYNQAVFLAHERSNFIYLTRSLVVSKMLSSYCVICLLFV